MFFIEYKNKLHRILVHLFFWFSYLIFFTSLSVVSADISFFEIMLRTMYYLPVDIFVTYITIYWLLPKFFITKKYFVFSILFLALAFITIFLNQFITYFIYIPIYFSEKIGTIKFFQLDMYVYLASTYVVVVFAGGIKLAKLWILEKQGKTKLEKENAESELGLLKSQINPHFIFNTLNNIDALIQSDPEKASQSIIRLSEVMRYVSYEATSDYVPIEKEINYLNSFVQLQTLRYGENCIDIQMKIDHTGRMIAPMLFIPLVENAIKHGDKKGSMPFVSVKIYIGSKIDFHVENRLSLVEQNKDAFGGIGLKNLKRRLELIYPGRYGLDCDISDGKTYKAHLWIR